MGHFAHLRNIPSNKQVWAKQWLNNRVSWKLLSALYPKDAVCLVESGPVVIERGILKSYHCDSFAIYLLSSLGKGCGPSFEQIWIPFSQKMLCQVWLKLHGPVVHRIIKCCLCIFAIISPWKKFEQTWIPFT